MALPSVRLPLALPEHGPALLASGGVQHELTYVLQSLRRLGIRAPLLDALAREVLLELHASGAPLGPARDLRPRLFEMAFRAVTAHHRNRLREILRAVPAADAGDGGAASAPSGPVTRTMVTAALGAVPRHRRAVLIMHDLEAVSLPEVARVFCVPLATVYVRLCRARRELEVELRRMVGKKKGK